MGIVSIVVYLMVVVGFIIFGFIQIVCGDI